MVFRKGRFVVSATNRVGASARRCRQHDPDHSDARLVAFVKFFTSAVDGVPRP